MGDGVVGSCLRIRRREMLERGGVARAEDVVAFVILEHDHDDVRDSWNIRSRSGALRTSDDDGRDADND